MARKNSRNSVIRRLGIIAIIALLIGIISFALYGYFNHPQLLSYKENTNIDYKVHIKDNEFYEESYLEKDNQYIADLIDKIETKLYYKLNLPGSVKYEYSYKAKATVEVKENSNNNSIYRIEEELLDGKPISSRGSLIIDEIVNIDYSRYNDLINKFKNVYELKNTTSSVEVSLYLNVKDFSNTKQTMEERKVASIKIPLAENTISIENNAKNIEDRWTLESSKLEHTIYFIYVGILATIVAIVMFVFVYLYSKRTRTAEMIYEKEIKSITNNYDSYIQRINDSYDIGTSQVIKIESFNDILEIRDTLKQPILMLENKEKNGTFFIIPATNSIIYTYALRVVDIEAKMNGKEIPTYDITEIPHTEFVKNKKYTDDYIKEELTRTSLMPVVDEKNIIKGNKDKEMDLYDQLELTRSFSIEEIKKALKDAKKTSKKTSNKKTPSKTTSKKTTGFKSTKKSSKK